MLSTPRPRDNGLYCISLSAISMPTPKTKAPKQNKTKELDKVVEEHPENEAWILNDQMRAVDMLISHGVVPSEQWKQLPDGLKKIIDTLPEDLRCMYDMKALVTRYRVMEEARNTLGSINEIDFSRSKKRDEAMYLQILHAKAVAEHTMRKSLSDLAKLVINNYEKNCPPTSK